MTNELIHLPSCFRDFQNGLRDQAVLSLRWNDLSREGKEKVASAIKRRSNLWTIRNSPKASVENIISALNATNPIIEQTQRNRWSFNGGTLSSRRNLEGISHIINQTLQLRRTAPRWRDFFLAIAGWDNYEWARDHADIENNRIRMNIQHQQHITDSNEEEIQNEISLADVVRASTQASIRNH